MQQKIWMIREQKIDKQIPSYKVRKYMCPNKDKIMITDGQHCTNRTFDSAAIFDTNNGSVSMVIPMS